MWHRPAVTIEFRRNAAHHTVHIPRFGISTHLFHERRLDAEQLQAMAARGFEAVELFATRTHFDYHDADTIARVRGWLADAGLVAWSMHAPIVDAIRDGQWAGSYSIATGDEASRRRAVEEVSTALRVAERIPYRVLVVHVGVPDAEGPSASDNQRAAAAKSLETLYPQARAAGVRLALEVIPNALSAAPDLVRLIEDDLDLPDLGICLDTGHAHLQGDVADAIDAASGYLASTHVHDNHGRRDDHLSPFEGTIDWPSVAMTFAKVGYDGTLMLEIGGGPDPAATLARAAAARERLEALVSANTFDFGDGDV